MHLKLFSVSQLKYHEIQEIIYHIDICKEIITMPSKKCWKTAILYMYMYDWYMYTILLVNLWISETKPKTTLLNVNYECIFT